MKQVFKIGDTIHRKGSAKLIRVVAVSQNFYRMSNGLYIHKHDQDLYKVYKRD